MKLYMIKTFQDRENPNKKFHHVNLFGLKFRVANNKRSWKTTSIHSSIQEPGTPTQAQRR